MAISKILHMKDSGNSFHARHLKRALDYVMNPEKTQGGRLVGAINCQTDMAFEQMMDTKKQFGKTDKRQGYHIILSFKEDEVEPDRAFEITQKFVAEYLGDAYEAVFVVHDNTDHVHSHIVFNSVSFVDGKKYRYEKPAWVEQVENLLVALEMYRIEEEKAINHLADILTAYGIDVSAEEIRTTETETLKTTVREKVEVR